jgi:hypothetical protein
VSLHIARAASTQSDAGGPHPRAARSKATACEGRCTSRLTYRPKREGILVDGAGGRGRGADSGGRRAGGGARPPPRSGRMATRSSTC